MPKEKATRKTKAKAVADGGKKKKGELNRCLNDLPVAPELTGPSSRPQRSQARPVCLHVFCQRAA